MASPDIDNYTIGKGNVYFSDDGSTWVHVGNVPRFEFEQSLETLDHFSSMEGVKTRDLQIITGNTATLTIDIEEITNMNLQIALMTGTSKDIGSVTSVRKWVKLTQTQDYGPTREYIFPSVDFKPSGAIGFISEGIQTITLEGSVNVSLGRFGYWSDIAGTSG